MLCAVKENLPVQILSSNCLAIKLKVASNQELEIAFVYNPNDETAIVKNLKKGIHHMADSGCFNQLIIWDENSILNRDLDYVDYKQDPHQISREFLCGL